MNLKPIARPQHSKRPDLAKAEVAAARAATGPLNYAEIRGLVAKFEGRGLEFANRGAVNKPSSQVSAG
jgi:hypothetical protein